MDHKYLQAGEIVSTHGVRGEVKILPWADAPEFLLNFPVFFLDGLAYPVESCRVHKTCVLSKLKGVDDPAAAQALRGKTVWIDRENLQLKDGAVFIADLIGLRVLCQGQEIGAVADVITMPGNDVYVVRGQHEYMIPAVKEFVLEINVPEGFVRVKLLEGMQTDAD